MNSLKFLKVISHDLNAKCLSHNAPFFGLGVKFLDENGVMHRQAVYLANDAPPEEIATALEKLAQVVREKKFISGDEHLVGKEANLVDCPSLSDEALHAHLVEVEEYVDLDQAMDGAVIHEPAVG